MFRRFFDHNPLGNRACRPSAAVLTAIIPIVLSAANAAASPITRVLDFTASNFRPANAPAAAPVDPVKGSITITFDPGALVFHSSSITVDSLNIQVDFPVVFDYTPTSDQLFISGCDLCEPNSSLGVTIDTNNFLAEFFDASGNPVMYFFAYGVNGVADIYTASSFSVSVAAPEPAPVALLSVPLAVLAGIRRRKATTTTINVPGPQGDQAAFW